LTLLLGFNFQSPLAADVAFPFESAFTQDGAPVQIEYVYTVNPVIAGDADAAVESGAAVWSDVAQTGVLDVGDGATGLLTGAPGFTGDALSAGTPSFRGLVLEFALKADGWFSPFEWRTTVRADPLPPAEWLGGPAVRTDSWLPLEWRTGVIRDGAYAEWVALYRGDMAPPLEAGATQQADAWAPVELLLTARADPLPPIEVRATARGDFWSPAEAAATARADPPAAAENQATQVIDPPARLELLLAVRADPPAEAEFVSVLPAVRGDSFAPIELLQTLRLDNAPVEWAALFRWDALPPGEFLLVARLDPAAAAENTAVWRRDLFPPIEASSAAARSDASLPVEALLSAVRDGAWAEFGALLRCDPLPATEWALAVRNDPGAPAETGTGAARADLSLPLEALLSVRFDSHPVEFLSFVRALIVSGDSLVPVEWAGIIRADGVPAVEATALSAADKSALLAWFRTLAADFLPQLEARQTNPAPLYVVARGRLRPSPGRIRLLTPEQ
jgi:hypothetical protein